MPDRIDTAVQAVKSLRFHFSLNGWAREAELPFQLPNRDHTVLPLGEVGQSSTRLLSSFVPHGGTKDDSNGVLPRWRCFASELHGAVLDLLHVTV